MMRWLFCALMLACAPAHAAWLQIRSAHFDVRIDATEAETRGYVERLEQFNLGLRRLYGISEDATVGTDTRPQRLNIFVLRQEMFGKVCRCGGVLGYYLARAGDSAVVSLVDKVDEKLGGDRITPQSVLLHEYSHHFMMVYFPAAYPLWYREGFAEFNSYADFRPDGSVVIGLPANDRAEVLGWYRAGRISIEALLTGKGDYSQIYARGWLLTHYLTLGSKRAGQMDTYLGGIARGQDNLASARAAFGDLHQLSRELVAYGDGRTIFAPWRIEGSIRRSDMTMRPMSAAEIAILPVHVRSISRNKGETGRFIAADARGVAKRYPEDATVQLTVAEAEFGAGNWQAAADAADKVLRLDPGNIDALVWRGRSGVALAAAAKATDPGLWKQARSWLLKANRLDPDAVLPLAAYYQSFIAAGTRPSDGAVTGLKRAAVLAPEDAGIRTMVGERMLIEGDAKFARNLLAMVAFAPHAKADSRARQLIALIDAGKIDEAKALSAVPDSAGQP